MQAAVPGAAWRGCSVLPTRIGAHCAACAASTIAIACSSSSAVGANASTIARIWFGWMLHMRV